MGKEIGRSYKYNRSKSLSLTLKKPVLSSSAHHTLCINISNQPVTSHPRQHKGSLGCPLRSEERRGHPRGV